MKDFKSKSKTSFYENDNLNNNNQKNFNFTLICDRYLFKACSVFCRLRERQSRRRFCHSDVQIINEIDTSSLDNQDILSILNDIEDDNLETDNKQEQKSDNSLSTEIFFTGKSTFELFSWIIFNIPFALPFRYRTQLFYCFVELDKSRHSASMFAPGIRSHITIRRSHILEDGYSNLSQYGSDLKGNIQIEFVDSHGMVETGIDGGGLFKEFITELMYKAYNPDYGLFKETPDNFLYPNPGSDIHSNHLKYFYFLGLILGKSMYDGILVEPQFANFFLCKFKQKINIIHDLSSLDRELYEHLVSLKDMNEETIRNLGLTFSVTSESFGKNLDIDLKLYGSNIYVDKSNLIEFVFLMANYKLNIQIKEQSDAFVKGLYTIISPKQIKLFMSDELQQLISGSQKIDRENLRQNTYYSSGYNEKHLIILQFQEIVDKMSDLTLAKLLKFSTSCSRAPLLGFQAMSPKFCIQRSGEDSDLLPTASTCMNLLKIPHYSSKTKLEQKLNYAINFAEGFQLS